MLLEFNFELIFFIYIYLIGEIIKIIKIIFNIIYTNIFRKTNLLLGIFLSYTY